MTSKLFTRFNLLVVLALGGLLTAITILLGATVPVQANPNTLYVTPDGDCGGASPCYTTIQAAVDAANSGDVIKVATGIYTSVNTQINKTLTIQGGYTTTNWTVPYPITQPTTLDAQGQGRVLFISGGGPWITPTIEGLRITGGSRPGMLEYGGGVYIESAEATFNTCQIFSNTAWFGGGLGGRYSSVTLNSSTVVSNAAKFGGGLLLDTDSDATLNGNIVSFNKATSNGGGVFLGNADATLCNTIIADNQANVKGGGLHVADSTVRLLHTTFARNMVISDSAGSGILVERYSVRTRVWMTNTILVSHTVGISVTTGATATLESTLWGRGAWANGVDWGGFGDLITGTHNYWDDPAFVNPDDGNYHISANSAAIDKGVNAGVVTDIDGQARPFGTAPDLGADEYEYTWPYQLYLPLVLRN